LLNTTENVKGVYLNSLKIDQVIPGHKKGDKSACTNCRSISLLSQFSKVFERALQHSLNLVSSLVSDQTHQRPWLWKVYAQIRHGVGIS